MNELVFPEYSFDAAVCVFGLFFAENIVSTVRAMLRSLTPGGQIAITTLGPKFFAPLYDVFVDAATRENPAIDTDVPWKRTEDIDRMRHYLAEADVSEINVDHEVSALPLRTPEDWWHIVMGTGIRRLAMELNADALPRVRDHNLEWIRDHNVSSVELDVLLSWTPTMRSNAT